MPVFALVVPVLPGKESLVREVSATMKRRASEHTESRTRAGIHAERVYLQRNPDGSCAVVAYVETARSFAESIGKLAQSDLPIDAYFLDKNREISGIDFRTAQGPDPELTASWTAPGASGRGARGSAFAAPLMPGKLEAARAFADEAYNKRRVEMTESRVAIGLTREDVFLVHTPVRDLLVVYLEGADPSRANREFAASALPFDTWFKQSLKPLFPPHIDFNQPMPANEELFSWDRS